jgi:dUTP pyrophosphatase
MMVSGVLFEEGSMNVLNVKVKKMFDDVEIPQYSTDGSGCFDIKCYSEDWFRDEFNNSPDVFDSYSFRTGLQFEIPEGYVMLVFSRSGHGFKYDVRLANCVGVIDSDYRGELKVKLTNDSNRMMLVQHGDKIAQAMIIPIPKVAFEVAEELSSTGRGEGGFGSTGK